MLEGVSPFELVTIWYEYTSGNKGLLSNAIHADLLVLDATSYSIAKSLQMVMIFWSLLTVRHSSTKSSAKHNTHENSSHTLTNTILQHV